MRRLIPFSVAVALGIVGWRRIQGGWGTTAAEQMQPLPGDELITFPDIQTTHAITIDGSSAEIWPWLVQMGYHRGGWYTLEWVDRLWAVENPSADEILAEFQNLEAGDTIPDGPPGTAFFVVEEIQPERALVLRSRRHPLTGMPPDLNKATPGPYLSFTWVFALEPLAVNVTRLYLRARSIVSPHSLTPLIRLGLVPADHVMASVMLRGIKRRVETLAHAVQGEPPWSLPTPVSD